MFFLTEEFLYSHKNDSIADSAAFECVNFAVSEIIKEPGLLNLKSLSDRIGYSQKHFIELFKRQVGVTPKNYLKIHRFQKTISDIENAINGFDMDWNSVALDSGFYDQSHFINDFKFFSGFTPGEYLDNKSDTLNYIPVR